MVVTYTVALVMLYVDLGKHVMRIFREKRTRADSSKEFQGPLKPILRAGQLY